MRFFTSLHEMLPAGLLVVPPAPLLPLPATRIDGVGLYTADQMATYSGTTLVQNTFVIYDNAEFNAILDEMQASADVSVKAFANRLTVIRDQVYGPPAPPSQEEVFLSNDEYDEEEQSQAPTAD